VGTKGGEDALASVKLPPDLRAWLPDPEGAKAYPIVTYTWLMFYRKNQDPKKSTAMRELVDWCLTEGQKMSTQMGYIPLPEGVASEVKKAAANIQ
jgi:phosphate transport system substrate-binding protein